MQYQYWMCHYSYLKNNKAATFKYCIVRLIVSRPHTNYTVTNKANITINSLAPSIRYTCHTVQC